MRLKEPFSRCSFDDRSASWPCLSLCLEKPGAVHVMCACEALHAALNGQTASALIQFPFAASFTSALCTLQACCIHSWQNTSQQGPKLREMVDFSKGPHCPVLCSCLLLSHGGTASVSIGLSCCAAVWTDLQGGRGIISDACCAHGCYAHPGPLRPASGAPPPAAPTPGAHHRFQCHDPCAIPGLPP